MNATHLLEHFDRLAEAPDAVPRLRRFILDLAVRGRLVEQDPKDEPALALLKRIQVERARLVKEGKIKDAKAPATFVGDVPANVLPSHWSWIPFGATVNSHLGGGTPSKANSTYWGGDILWASVKDVGKSKYLDDTIDRITKAGLANSSSNLVEPGSLIVVTRMGLGKVSINRIAVTINQDLRALSISSLVAIDYCYIFFKTHGFEGSGLTVKGIKVEELLGIPFPLPPLAEQHRIVAKVDELMALCDQLEAAQQEREHRRDRLAAASLQRLNQTTADTAPEAQREHARFHLHHLPHVTTRPEHIKAMRQLFLNLAVRGKLVEQSLDDESVTKLMQRLGVKSHQPPAGLVSLPVPSTWAWVTIDEIASVSSGTTPSRAESAYYSSGGTPWVTSGETNNAVITSTAQHVTAKALKETSLRLYPPGTLIVAMYGEGKTRGQIAELGIAATTNQACAAIVLKLEDIGHRRYVKLFFQKIYEEIRELAAGGAQPNLNGGKIKSTLIPLPPLAEQYRIVAKVDELIALCDQLEAQLTITQTDSRQLLEAVLNGALGIARVPMESEVVSSPSSIPDSDLQPGKASRFMTTNPAMTVDQLLECIDDLGGSASPDRLLKQTGLGEDVEAFYDLLRAARDSGKVTAQLGAGLHVRRHANAD
jgi:type I restriction enzyme S subunit